MKYSIFLLVIAFAACTNAQQTNSSSAEPCILMEDDAGKSGYHTKNGETIIPMDTYAKCLTDTFHTHAIVLTKDEHKWVVIDRQQKVLYEIFPFDNGPDYPSDGLFRMVQDGKIGYADATNYTIVIKPQFDCAFPFENGKAKVSKNCKTTTDGDHQSWVSDDWKWVDKKGNF